MLTFDTTTIVVSFFGTLIAILITVIGVLSRFWWRDLIAKVDETRAEAARNAKANADRDEKLLDLTERQNVEIAKLGEKMVSLDRRITDVDRNLGQRVSDMEARQHRLANQLNTVFLAIGIKGRKGEPPIPDDDNGDQG